MILVTTPTGQIGSAVVQYLLKANANVRVIARDPSRLPDDVRQRCEVVEGSHGDASVLKRALSAVGSVFWVVPPNVHATQWAAYIDFTRPASDLIKRIGSIRTVSVTAVGRGTAWADNAGLVSSSLRADDMLALGAAAHRGLAMPSFMENITNQIGAMKAQGSLFGPIDPDRPLPWTSTRDLAAVAANLLLDTAWGGYTEMPILGPHEHSYAQIAAIISEVTGRKISYQQVPLHALKHQLIARGASESFAEGCVDMYRAKNEGMESAAAHSTSERTKTSFRTWCELVLKPAMRD